MQLIGTLDGARAQRGINAGSDVTEATIPFDNGVGREQHGKLGLLNCRPGTDVAPGGLGGV